MKPKTTSSRKVRDIDKDTVVAYHEFIQGRIQGELNGVTIGPGYMLSRFAFASFLFGLACLIVGILIITLRHRHVYLVDWDAQFLGPFFIIMFLLCGSLSTFLLLLAKQRTNQYRKDLAFRPIGDYGVAVVHKSKLTYDDQKKTELKSGTTPHNVRHPGRPGVNDRGNRGDYSKSRSYDSRGYKDDYDRRDRDNRDGRDRGRDRGDRPPRRDDDREKRRPPDDDDRRRRQGDPRRRPPDGERRRPDDRGDRPRRPPGPDNRDDRPRRPPPGPEDEKRRAEARRRYEEDKRLKQEEDRRRAELRKQAVESYERKEQEAGFERGVDVGDGDRTYQVQTTVKLSRELQGADESEL